MASPTKILLLEEEKIRNVRTCLKGIVENLEAELIPIDFSKFINQEQKTNGFDLVAITIADPKDPKYVYLVKELRATCRKIPLLAISSSPENSDLLIRQYSIENKCDTFRIRKEIERGLKVRENLKNRFAKKNIINETEIDLEPILEDEMLPKDIATKEFYTHILSHLEEISLHSPHKLVIEKVGTRPFQNKPGEHMLIAKVTCKKDYDNDQERYLAVYRISHKKDDLCAQSAIQIVGGGNVVGCYAYFEGIQFGVSAMEYKESRRLDYLLTLYDNLMQKCSDKEPKTSPRKTSVPGRSTPFDKNLSNKISDNKSELIKLALQTSALNSISRYKNAKKINERYLKLKLDAFSNEGLEKKIFEPILKEKEKDSLQNKYLRDYDRKRLENQIIRFKRQLTKIVTWVLREQIGDEAALELLKETNPDYNKKFSIKLSETDNKTIEHFTLPLARNRFLLPQHLDFGPYNLRKEMKLTGEVSIDEFDIMKAKADSCHFDILALLCNYHINLRPKDVQGYADKYYKYIMSAIRVVYADAADLQDGSLSQTKVLVKNSKDRKKLTAKFGIKNLARSAEKGVDRDIIKLFKRENYLSRVMARLTDLGRATKTQVIRGINNESKVYAKKNTQDPSLNIDSKTSSPSISVSEYGVRKHVKDYKQKITNANNGKNVTKFIVDRVTEDSPADLATCPLSYIFHMENLQTEIYYAIEKSKDKDSPSDKKDVEPYKNLEILLSDLRIEVDKTEYSLNLLEGKFYKVSRNGEREQFRINYDFTNYICPIDEIITKNSFDDSAD